MFSYIFQINNNFKNKSYFLAQLLKLLSQKNRLQIIFLLDYYQSLTVRQLIIMLNLSQSLTSHHLKDLKEVNLVYSKKNGRQISYSLTNFAKNFVFLLNQMSEDDLNNEDKIIFIKKSNVM